MKKVTAFFVAVIALTVVIAGSLAPAHADLTGPKNPPTGSGGR